MTSGSDAALGDRTRTISWVITPTLWTVKVTFPAFTVAGCGIIVYSLSVTLVLVDRACCSAGAAVAPVRQSGMLGALGASERR